MQHNPMSLAAVAAAALILGACASAREETVPRATPDVVVYEDGRAMPPVVHEGGTVPTRTTVVDYERREYRPAGEYSFAERSQFQSDLLARVNALDPYVARVQVVGPTGERRARYLREQQQSMLDRVDRLDDVTESEWASERADIEFRMQELERWFENEASVGSSY